MAVILGWRSMKPIWCKHPRCGGVVLQGVYSGHLFERASLPAVCLGYAKAVAVQDLQHASHEAPPQEHIDAKAKAYGREGIDPIHEISPSLVPAPHELCTCGYYIYFDLEHLQRSPFANYAQALCYVVAIGHCILYTAGARAERYRLLGLWFYPHRGKQSYAWTGDHYLSWEEVFSALAERLQVPISEDLSTAHKLPTGVLPELPEEILALW